MDQENYEFLTERLKYSGFEDKFNKDLLGEIQARNPEFQLWRTMDIEGKKVDFDLYFKKSEVSERYFFNKMDVGVVNPNEEYRSHMFYQNQGITAKEAFNMLEGRAVQKSLLNSENQPYKAWLQLDLSKKEDSGSFKLNQYHERYGFNLEETLRKFPIKELNDQTKTEWMLKSLQKGNTFPVEMERNGKGEIMFIEASPKFNSINIYDASMSLVKNADLLKSDLKQGKGIEYEPEGSKKRPEEGGEAVGRLRVSGSIPKEGQITAQNLKGLTNL